jgi:hypothetical protein
MELLATRARTKIDQQRAMSLEQPVVRIEECIAQTDLVTLCRRIRDENHHHFHLNIPTSFGNGYIKPFFFREICSSHLSYSAAIKSIKWPSECSLHGGVRTSQLKSIRRTDHVVAGCSAEPLKALEHRHMPRAVLS